MAKLITVSVCAIAALLAFFGWKLTARGAYESAEYAVIVSEGRFEIREYPDLMLAATRMRPESQGDDGSFMRLFRYISGANSQKQKIAMTTPVFMESKSSEERDHTQMGFVIPKQVVSQQVPSPSDGNVEIRKRDGGRFAVVRFSGRMNRSSLDRAEKDLLDWIESNGMAVAGPAESAGYDPPWTPGPLRRNEVLLRLETE